MAAAATVVIYFWGLLAVVQGPGESPKTSADVVLVDISKSLVPPPAAHPHYPRLVVNMKNVDWEKSGVATGDALYPDWLLPMGREFYGVWDLRGLDVTIMDSPAPLPNMAAAFGALRFHEQETLKFTLPAIPAVPPNPPFPEISFTIPNLANKGFFASPRLMRSGVLDPSVPSVERAWLLGAVRPPIAASRIRLSDGVLDAFHVENEEVWQYKTGAFEESHQPDPKTADQKVLFTKLSAPAARYERPYDKAMVLCLGPCNAKKTHVALALKKDETEIDVTISNYPLLDNAHSGGALHHFAAYYDLLPNPPALKDRIVPFKPEHGDGKSGSLFGGLVGNVDDNRRAAAIDAVKRLPEVRRDFTPDGLQNPPDCQLVFLISK